MAKILANKNGQALMSADGKIYKGAVEQVIPEGYIKPSGTIEITSTEEIDVSQYAKAQVVDSNLEPQNIVKDVTILGVTGTFEGGSSEEYPNEAIKYYKENRNKNYPYFPLPSEMEETQDTIYMLYDASGYMCCPVFNITFTSCVVTIQKYNNTELVSEYTLNDVVSGTTYYMQFSEEDSDYSTYNYIVIKLQGNITKHNIGVSPKFNNVSYNKYASSELLEVSGKCVGCNIKVIYYLNGTNYNTHSNLEYYSFNGITNTNMECMFYYCSSLKAIPELDTHLATSMKNMFSMCYSLKSIAELDTSNVTNMENTFSYCKSLVKMPTLNTNKVTTMKYMFSDDNSLQTILELDTSSVTDMSYAFSNCYTLSKLNITNVKVSFSLSYSTMLSQSELVKILNNLATVETTQTLTLGSTLLAKLTEEEKAIATAKGWTLA